MSQAKVVVTDYIEPDLDWEAEELAKRDIEFAAYQLKFAPHEELIAAIRDADVLIVNMRPITAEIINALERCKLIIRHGVGYDNIDLAAAAARGIRVANEPEYCLEEVAEQAVALIMACARGLFQSRQLLELAVENGQWDFSGLRPAHRLKGQTLGIIGCGRIGSRVYHRTEGFGMRRIICDSYLPEKRLRYLGIDRRYELDELLAESDIVTLHCPLNDETRHIINKEKLQMMKPSAYLVNTARGAIVDTEALTKALAEGWIAGAGVDVYEIEPPPEDLGLLQQENATLSAHLAWYSEESGWQIREDVLADVYRCLAGEPPISTVNPEVEQVLGDRVYREV